MLVNYIRRFNYNIKRRLVTILLHEQEHLVALGFGIGSFIAMMPTPGLSIFIGLGVAALMKPASRPGILLALVVWNIWTLIPIFAASAWLGELIFSKEAKVYFHAEFLNQIVHFTRRLLVGNLIINIPLSFAGYHLALKVIGNLRKRKKEKPVMA